MSIICLYMYRYICMYVCMYVDHIMTTNGCPVVVFLDEKYYDNMFYVGLLFNHPHCFQFYPFTQLL